MRAPGFVLTVQSTRDGDRLSIAGELNMATTGLLDAEMVDLYGREPCGRTPRDLVLDLTDVTFLDVMGVASLGRAHERALVQGGMRLGLPAAAGPRRLLALAVDFGWLPPVFAASTPTF